MPSNPDLKVTYKPVNIPIQVRMEVPSEEIRKLMKWPNTKKVLAVRVPNTYQDGYVHYLTRNKQAMSHGYNDYRATIAALTAHHRQSARAILGQLARGEPLTLDYSTPLPYLDNTRGPLRKPVISTGNKKRKK